MAENEFPKKASEHVWAIVGKVGAVVGVVIGAITLWNLATAPKGKLVGEVQYAAFSYPPTLDEYAAQILHRQQADVVKDLQAMKVSPTELRIKALMSEPDFLEKTYRQLFEAGKGPIRGIV